jgi:Rieske 2Fe-2S family protein
MSVGTLQPALPKHMYVDAAFWERERDQALHASWFCAGRIDDLGLDRPGAVCVVDVVGESVLVMRDLRGELHAAYNVCRHRGSQVVPVDDPSALSLSCAVGALRCPYHSWTYDLAGQLLKAPHTEGVDDFDRAQFGLHPVAVGEWGGFCFVNLTPASAEPLLDEVAAVVAPISRYPVASLRRGLRLEYDVAANYKVLSENYNECYHCGPVHPELTRLVPSFAGGGVGLDWDSGIEHRPDAWTFTMTAPRPDGRFPTSTTASGGAIRACCCTRTCGCRARPTTSRRSRCGRSRSTGLALCATSSSRPTRWPRPTSTRPTRATSGTSSTVRTGRSASRCSAG